MLCPKITDVEALDNYKVKLKYETGEIKIFNVLPYIFGTWYEESAKRCLAPEECWNSRYFKYNRYNQELDWRLICFFRLL